MPEKWRIGKRQNRIKEIKAEHKDDPHGMVATTVVMVEELADSFEDFKREVREQLDEISERQAKDDIRQAKTEGDIKDLTTTYKQHAGTPKAHDKGNGNGKRPGTIGNTGLTVKELIGLVASSALIMVGVFESQTGAVTAAAGGG